MQYRFLAVCLLLFNVVFIHAVPQQDSTPLVRRHYTDQNGLPQNSVKSICKDEHGFVWLTTENGLVRYDGNHFMTASKQIDRLRSSRFSAIFLDNVTDEPVAVTAAGEPLRIHHGIVEKDNLALRRRLDRLSAVSWLIFPGGTPPNTPTLPEEHNGVMVHSNDSIVYAGSQYLYAVAGKQVTWLDSTHAKEIDYLTHETSAHLFVLRDTLYALYSMKEVRRLFSGNTTTLPIVGDWLATKHSSAFLFRSEGWNDSQVITDGLHWYSLQKHGQHFTTKLLLSDFSLEKNRIISGFYDKQTDRLLLGSATDGLFEFFPASFKVLKTDLAELDNVFYAQTLLGNNNILTAQGHRVNVTTHELNHVASSRLIHTDKYNILQDDRGFVWTRAAKTLIQLDSLKLQTLREWQLPDFISSLFIGADQWLYIGTQGRQVWRMKAGHPEATPQHYVTLPAVPTCMAREGNILWIGTQAGLFLLNLPDQKVEPVARLSDTHVRSLYVSHDNEVWVSTYEDGFFLWQPGKERLTSFPVDKEQHLLTAHCIIEDNQGNFWISTNKGLYQTQRKDLLDYAEGKNNDIFYRCFTVNNGLSTNEFNGGCQPCGLLLPDGWISLPSMNGLVLFNPAAITIDHGIENIFLDEIQQDGVDITVKDHISISRFTQQVKIFISTPHWGAPYKVQWRYALTDGNDTTWVEPDNNLITLSQLSSGNHTLLIRKQNLFDEPRYSYKSISIVVPFAWYLHPLAIAGWGLAILLIIWLSVRLRLRFIKSQNALLERKVREQTHSLREALMSLESSQQKLAYKTALQERIIRSVSHDVKAPMGYLKMINDRTLKSMEADGLSKYLTPMKIAGDNYLRLHAFMENLLQYVKTITRSVDIPLEAITLKPLIEEKRKFFTDLLDQRKTIVFNDVNAQHVVVTNLTLFSIIVHNILDNALKVSGNGIIRFSSGKCGKQILLIIEDSGPGIPKDILEWLNQKDAQHPVTERFNNGLGLYIVKDLTALLTIEMQAANKENGAEIRLLLPTE